MDLRLVPAVEDDAAAIAALRAAVAGDLTARFGRGHWSSPGTAKGVLRDLASGGLLVVRHASGAAATLVLGTRKPWAIDRTFFSHSERPLYLTGMAVAPELQGRGLGRECLAQAAVHAATRSADAIRLDAYDLPAGAGGFYARCGYAQRGRRVYRTVPLIYYERLLGATA